MATPLMLILLINLIINSFSQPTNQTAYLKYPTSTDNDAVVQFQNIDFSSSDTGWTETITSQLSWQWKIFFQTQIWNFPSDRPARFQLKIYSNSNFNDGLDRDLIVSFSQNRQKYVTILIRMDNLNPNEIHPACDKEEIPTQKFSSGDIEQLINADNGQDRLYKSTQGDIREPILPETSWANPNGNPMALSFYNDPVEGISYYDYSLPNQPVYQWCGFNESWTSEFPLDIFISGDNDDERINIDHFEILLEYDLTLQPTPAPTGTWHIVYF